ncbi:hypothetical protein IKS86_08925 [bacterium]|nr:hypothetical protein [bacterium]
MRKLFQIMLLAAVVLLVSCGGSKKSQDSCPDGYDWSGTDCVKRTDQSDSGDSTVTDTDTPSDDGDTADDTEPDEDADTEEPDNEQSDYNGSCKEIRSGDAYEINVETNKLTIGNVTINGKSDNAALYGEIWAENRETLSEFKLGDVNSEFSGKTVNIPKGRYSFAFRPVSSANKVAIEGLDNVDMSVGDKKLDFDLPLYHLTGKVLNNSDAAFTVEESYQESTQLVVKNGAFEKVLPYSEFAAYDLLLPKGTYSVYFKGQLAAGEGIFEGTVIDSSQAFAVEEDTERDIKIQTITFTGSIAKKGYADDGYEVNKGQLILVENPPLGAKNGVVVSDLSAASAYSITVTAGAKLNLLYLPEADSYPVRYIKLETWSSETETPASHNITLDFGRVYGKITFLGGNSFPTLTNCSEADCTIGKLKATLETLSMDEAISLVVKDLGTDLDTDEEGNVVGATYDALLVRRNFFKYTDSEGQEKSEYIGKTYAMNFESHLNDIKGGFTALPFSVPATYTNSEGNKVSSFAFYVTEADGTKTWLTEKNIDIDVSPSKVTGKITLNGSTFETDKSDFIKLKDSSGIEYPVLNFSELSGGEFTFYAPKGTYDVLYDGEHILLNSFKTYIEHDFEIGGNGNTHDFEIKTGSVALDFNVNGTPFAEWVEAQKNLDDMGLAVNIDKTASDFVLDLSKKEGKYVAEVLLGSTVNAYLELVFADKVSSEKSYSRIRLLSSQNMTSGITVKDDLTLVKSDISVKLNGNAVKASGYAAKLRIQGTNSSEIFCPAETAVSAFFKKGEYKSPTPELFLNEGFEAKHKIPLKCLYFGE